MTPTWLNDVVTAFGRQMALTRFALNERGVAGVRFENGLTLRFEYADEARLVSMGVAAGDEPAPLRHVLAAGHPAEQRGGGVCAPPTSRSGARRSTPCGSPSAASRSPRWERCSRRCGRPPTG